MAKAVSPKRRKGQKSMNDQRSKPERPLPGLLAAWATAVLIAIVIGCVYGALILMPTNGTYCHRGNGAADLRTRTLFNSPIDIAIHNFLTVP
jgi:hypothetical protein